MRERKCAWMITKSDVVSFSSRQCVALASISSGSLSNTRLPSSPGIRNAQVRSRRSLVLSQDKIGYANIFFKVIFVLQVAKSKARSSVAVHRETGQKRNAARTRLVPRHRRARIRLSETCVQRLEKYTQTNTHPTRVHMNAARAVRVFVRAHCPRKMAAVSPGKRGESQIRALCTQDTSCSARRTSRSTRGAGME